jgi:hypothetical protein
MAVFSLLNSVMWKKWNNSKINVYLFNILAIIIAFLGVMFRGMTTLLVYNIVFFLFVAFILFVSYKDSKNKPKGKSLLVIYLLLFVFFFLNIIDILLPKFLGIYQIGIYLASTLLFMAILYRVLKKVGN